MIDSKHLLRAIAASVAFTSGMIRGEDEPLFNDPIGVEVPAPGQMRQHEHRRRARLVVR